MMPRAKKTGRCTSCAASRIFCVGVRVSSLRREMADDVLDHHHRAVDHHAEIQRAQRKQVGGNVDQVKADGGEQQRKGNGERDNNGAAHIAQEEEENDGDQDHAFGQVALDGLDGELDQVGAIEEGNDLDALGQDAVVELLDLLVDALQNRVGVVAFLQQHDAFDGVGIIDDRAVGAMGRAADLAQANLRPLRDGGDVFDRDGRAVRSS